MGILSDIFARVFPAGHPATKPGVVALAGRSASPAASSDMPPVDVPRVLSTLAARTPEKLDWHASIVDLMRLLRLDASPAGRRRLASELHYDGTADDDTMNRWLHRRVMQLLAANGGRLPAGLTG